MNKKILLIIVVFLMFPLVVLADEEVIITCDKLEMKNNEEIECQILVENLSFNVTSISGEIELDKNLELVSSSYDEEKWKMLDQNFNVKNINLISEEKDEENTFTIATFKVKAINKEEGVSTIKFNNVILGDENYESHEVSVEDISINVMYEALANPSTGIMQPWMIICLILGCAGLGYVILKNKKYI